MRINSGFLPVQHQRRPVVTRKGAGEARQAAASLAASGCPATLTSIFGLRAARNSSSVVTRASFKTTGSPCTTLITLLGTFGNSIPLCRIPSDNRM